MKNSAKKRIIIWSIVCILLVAVLVTGMIFVKSGKDSLSSLVFNTTLDTSNSIDLTEDIKEFEANEINSVIVGWTSGNVKIEAGKTDKIIVEVKAYNKLNNNDVVHYVNNNGTLGIYSEKQHGWNLFNNFTSKDIVITIPDNKLFENFEVSTASAESEINGINSENLDINTASGDVIIKNSKGDSVSMNSASGNLDIIGCSYPDVQANIVSGKVDVNGEFETIDCESVSGSVTVNSLTECDKIDAETVSGSVNITLPKSVESVNVEFDSVSGNLNSEIGSSTSANAPRINIDTVSGSATIKKAT